MAESSHAAFANNVVPSTNSSRNDEVDKKAKALLKKRKQWEGNEKRCMKERPKTIALRRKVIQTRTKWEDLQQMGIEHDNSEVDHEDILETIDYDTLHLAYDPESSIKFNC
ncbi:hypothetical protein CTI12_AA262260 [Artemisia annua]|uniref:Uncharacterized protein n=1 Tax=Artemisia annua TaxID=35608 RepID=A0A2U1MM54_ARTAN|nr:hypothetical protein CTI12_AA262260 [Artemisia annua]